MRLFKYVFLFILCTVLTFVTEKYIGNNSDNGIISNLLSIVIIEPALIFIVISIYDNRHHFTNDERQRFSKSNKVLVDSLYRNECALSLNSGERIPASLVHKPSLLVSVSKVETILVDSFFAPPNLIQINSNKILGINTNSTVFNSLTMRLDKLEENENNGITMFFSYSDYFSHMITNNSPDFQIDNTSIRELTEPGPVFSPLACSRCSNHLGVSVMIETSDGKLVSQLRNGKVSSYKNVFGPSASGALNADICLSMGKVNLEMAIMKEIEEELFLSESLKLFYLGTTREFQRSGKPESFFYAKSTKSSNEIQSLFEGKVSEESSCLFFSDLSHLICKWSELSVPLRTALYFIESFKLGKKEQA